MTHRTPIAATSIVALVWAAVMAATPASAQTDTPGSAGSGTGTAADKITCAELASMDSAVVPGTLYFVAGYHQGQKDSMNLTKQVQSGAMGADSSTSGSSTSGTMDSTTSPGTTDATAQIAPIGGYFEIPVAKVMTVCGQSPDRPVSEVIEEHRDATSN